jgi:3-deoxy-7-phosphoheptulonate synthase
VTEAALLRASRIVDELPEPNYQLNYQIEYPDRDQLVEAIAENIHNPGVATPQQIERLSGQFEAIGRGESRRPIIITNRCSERLYDDSVPIDQVAEETVAQLGIIKASHLVDPIALQRVGGQFIKPRTFQFEVSSTGEEVLSYMGPGINGPGLDERHPDPKRMVAVGKQAGDLQKYLKSVYGEPVYMAHEAISLGYEAAFLRHIRSCEDTGLNYLVSAHLPWLGKRTNDPNGSQAEFLSEIVNPIGIKIGPASSREHIIELSKKLNPKGKAGKLVFMLRLGAAYESRYPVLLQTIKSHAEGSIIGYDIHGENEINEYGQKIRSVQSIKRSIERLALALNKINLRLNLLHLETTSDDYAEECVEESNQIPKDKPEIDPLLNPDQTRRVIDFAVDFLN